jgi:hypothetical protein
MAKERHPIDDLIDALVWMRWMAKNAKLRAQTRNRLNRLGALYRRSHC